jgi:iron complex outermembrane receptor protein
MMKLRKVSGAVALGLGFGLGGSLAFAQQAAPIGNEAPAMEQIIITGSMIKRTNAETSEAVTVITAETLKNLGITTTEQALAHVTSVQSNVTTASSVASYSGHASIASLRSLGGSKTLVLVDGQRLANNVVFGNAVDINTIPFAAIERVEVLREGASALYGSDAIAGVINFITKKNFKGGEINLTGSHPQQSGGSSSDIDITWGKGDLATDGYNLLVTANFNKTNELRAAQRSFASSGYSPARGLANLNSPYGPFPGSYIDQQTTPPPEGGNLFQVGYPGCPGNPQLVAVDGSCQYKYSAVVDLVAPSHEVSGLVSFSKSLPGNNTFNAQYFYTKTYSSSWGGPQTYGFLMDPSSPYFPTAGNSTCVGCTASPVLNQQILALWTDPNNNRYNSDVNTEQRLLLTLTGSNDGWDYSGALNYSQNHNLLLVEGGYADFTQIAPGGVLSPLINPFGPLSAAGQNLIDSAYKNGTIGTGELTLLGAGGHASHDLKDFFGAGRAATVAVGLDARSEKIGYGPTGLTSVLQPATFYPPQDINGKRNVEALFAELDIPVTRKLDVTLSDRLDRYSDFGKKNNGKVAFRYQPLEILTFRGAASTGFRAPSLVDLYLPQTLGATSGSMNGPPCASGGTATGPFTATNCISQGMALSGGNTHLGPETSDNYDLGFVIAPIENLGITVDYYRISVKNEIQTIPSSAIYADPATFTSLYVLNNSGTLTPAPVAPAQCGSSAPYKATCGYILQNTQNTGGIQTSGFDVSVDYLLKTSYGRVRLGSEGTLVSNYRLQPYAGGKYRTLVGQWNRGFQPLIRWKQVVTADWSNGDWGGGLSARYDSPYTDEYTDQGARAPSTNGNQLTVASYTTWDAYGSWKPTKPLTVLVGVRNLFNKEPPFSNQTLNWQAGYDPVLGDPILRAYYAKLKYEF